MKNELGPDSSKNTLDQESVGIQEEIAQRFSRGPNKTIARGVAVYYANLQRDLMTRDDKLDEAAKWERAISDVEEGNIGYLKSLIMNNASSLRTESVSRDARDKLIEQAESLDNLADSLF